MGAGRHVDIEGSTRPEETAEQAIGRCVCEALGSEVWAQLSPATRIGSAGTGPSDRRDDGPPSNDQREIAAPYAVDLHGPPVPQGMVRRFAWFLITAMPPRDEVSVEQWALLAGFLDAQGESALAARMRRF